MKTIINTPSLLAICMLCASINTQAANLQTDITTSAQLNHSCIIKNPITGSSLDLNNGLNTNKTATYTDSQRITFTCTKSTLINILLTAGSGYQKGDDPSTLLAAPTVPRGVLTGVSSSNKLAYGFWIDSIGTNTMTPNENAYSSGASYRTTESNQDINFDIKIKVSSNTFPTPDIYNDTVTVNIKY